MARNLDQLALDLGGAEVPKNLDGKAWLRSFYARAYAAGREAGERAAEERLRKQIEWVALEEAAEAARNRK